MCNADYRTAQIALACGLGCNVIISFLNARAFLLASELELAEFLKSVEKRAYKRSLYHVRNEESALDIVQESMMKLAEHYSHKPAQELPMLFQRILSNCTLDWFRSQKVHHAHFSSFTELQDGSDDGDFDLLEHLHNAAQSDQNASGEQLLEQSQKLNAIELEIQKLPARQREAFLLRYWEEMDVAETAAAMGCSQGSVKTHCSRAVHTLALALKNQGIEP